PRHALEYFRIELIGSPILFCSFLVVMLAEIGRAHVVVKGRRIRTDGERLVVILDGGAILLLDLLDEASIVQGLSRVLVDFQVLLETLLSVLFALKEKQRNAFLVPEQGGWLLCDGGVVVIDGIKVTFL